MRTQRILILVLVFTLGLAGFSPAQGRAADPAPARDASAYDMIVAMNALRVANGLPALIEDPIVNAVAQATAEIMAANQMSWHIGDVRGRIAAAGYGGGGTVWATENFAVGNMEIDEIMAAWADPDHMRPAVTPAYCHVGAGVAVAANGRKYYILQAAYTSEKACGPYSPGPVNPNQPGATPGSSNGGGYVSQFIAPVKVATPDADGRTFHTVQAGQSFWSIAIAYQITIRDIETWNNVSRNIPLKTGQKLFIPNKNTEGYATPTPQGMIVRSTPDADGRVVHEVQAYQALVTIALAYDTKVDRILALNGLQKDWPLQIGQKLLIDPGHVTPSATLSAIQHLTPEADGKYYHTVQSGQTLSWISTYYGVPLASLMAWNGLTNDSIIRPSQRLLLMVTPPVTDTPTLPPVTATFTPQPSLTPTLALLTPTEPAQAPDSSPGLPIIPALVILALVLGLGALAWWLFTRKPAPE